MTSTDLVTIPRDTLRHMHAMLYHLLGKIKPSQISPEESADIADIAYELMKAMTKVAK